MPPRTARTTVRRKCVCVAMSNFRASGLFFMPKILAHYALFNERISNCFARHSILPRQQSKASPPLCRYIPSWIFGLSSRCWSIADIQNRGLTNDLRVFQVRLALFTQHHHLPTQIQADTHTHTSVIVVSACIIASCRRITWLLNTLLIVVSCHE